MAEAFGAEIRALVADAPNVIVALDAPLGWPDRLARALEEHKAGDRLGDGGDADQYVYRNTDAVVSKYVKKWPLDVGANYIARTAFAALELITQLRKGPHKLPMLWQAGSARESGLIEVYPAATFLSRALSIKGYKSEKKSEHEPARRALIKELCTEITISKPQQEQMLVTDHALDAVACVVAAKDFVDGMVIQPTEADMPLAEREGWIWFRKSTFSTY
jgi:hypothetical protein